MRSLLGLNDTPPFAPFPPKPQKDTKEIVYVPPKFKRLLDVGDMIIGSVKAIIPYPGNMKMPSQEEILSCKASRYFFYCN